MACGRPVGEGRMTSARRRQTASAGFQLNGARIWCSGGSSRHPIGMISSRIEVIRTPFFDLYQELDLPNDRA